MEEKSKKKYLSLKEAVRHSGYAADYIGQLIRKGKVEGKRITTGVSWLVLVEDLVNYCQKSKNLDIRNAIPFHKKYLSLKEAAKASGYAADYIGYLVRKKKISGRQINLGVSWLTTENSLKKYQQNTRQEDELKPSINVLRNFLIYDIVPPLRKSAIAAQKKISYWTTALRLFLVASKYGVVSLFFGVIIFGGLLVLALNTKEDIQSVEIYSLKAEGDPEGIPSGSYPEGEQVPYGADGASWQNPKNVLGPPDVPPTGDFNSFSDANSASYQSGPLHLVLSDFKATQSDGPEEEKKIEESTLPLEQPEQWLPEQWPTEPPKIEIQEQVGGTKEEDKEQGQQEINDQNVQQPEAEKESQSREQLKENQTEVPIEPQIQPIEDEQKQPQEETLVEPTSQPADNKEELPMLPTESQPVIEEPTPSENIEPTEPQPIQQEEKPISFFKKLNSFKNSLLNKIEKLTIGRIVKAKEIPTFSELVEQKEFVSAKIKISLAIGEKKTDLIIPVQSTPERVNAPTLEEKTQTEETAPVPGEEQKETQPEGEEQTPEESLQLPTGQAENPSIDFHLRPPTADYGGQAGQVPSTSFDETQNENPGQGQEEEAVPSETPLPIETPAPTENPVLPQGEPISFWQKINPIRNFSKIISSSIRYVYQISNGVKNFFSVFSAIAEDLPPSESTVTSATDGVGNEINPTEPEPQPETEVLPADSSDSIPDLDARLIIWYSFDGNIWWKLDEISSYPLSNFSNGGYLTYDAPFLTNWEDIKNLRIKIEGVVGGETTVIVYLDSVWVEVNYQEKSEEEKEELELRPIKKDWRADEEPTFEVYNKNQKPEKEQTGIVEEALAAIGEAADTVLGNNPKVEAVLSNSAKEERALKEKEDFKAETHSPTKITIFKQQSFRPGRYTVKINYEKNHRIYNFEQDFTWGVLALNVNKSIFQITSQDLSLVAGLKTPTVETTTPPTDSVFQVDPQNFSSVTGSEASTMETTTPPADSITLNEEAHTQEKAYLQMGVLDDLGRTICDAQLVLKITSPQSKTETEFSTENGAIQKNTECRPSTVTNTPDYYAYYDIPREIGIYKMVLTAKTQNGERTIEDQFEVRDSLPFEIERIGPTRIYPVSAYQMRVKIKANQDFTGQVIESVPNSFKIVSPQTNTTIKPNDNNQEIIWDVDWKTGETYELDYQFDAPEISPYFYLLGPLRLEEETTGEQIIENIKEIIDPLKLNISGDFWYKRFEETRQWQIAADSPAVPTPVFICGAECGIISAGASGLTPHWSAVTGTAPTASTTTFRSGLRAYRFNPSSAASNLSKTISSTRVVGRAAIRFATLPVSGTVTLMQLTDANGNLVIQYSATSTKLVAKVGTGAAVEGPAITTGKWYVTDFDANTSTATATLDWQVNYVSQTQAIKAQTSASMSAFLIGLVTATSADMFADDIILSYTAADYPLASGKVLGFSPNASGTHYFSNHFQYDTSTVVATPSGDVHSDINEVPLTETSNYIKQVVIGGNRYIRFGFADTTETNNARGLEIVSSQHAGGTPADNAGFFLDDNGTINTIYASSSDISQSSLIYNTKQYATAPSTSAQWTQTRINALAARWGYSGDITPNPYLDDVILEVEWQTLISVSGSIYQANETTLATTGYTIALSVNGQAPTTTVVPAGSSSYSFSNISADADMPVAVYIQGAADDANTISVSGGTDIANLNLFLNRTAIKNDNAGATANSDICTFSSFPAAGDNLFTCSGGVPTYNGSELHIFGNYTPGGNVNLSSSYHNLSTVTWGTNTITFTATTTGLTLSGTLNNTSAFNKVNFNGSGGGWTIQDPMKVSAANAADTLQVTAGTVTLGDGTGDNLEVNGKFVVSNGGIFQTIPNLATTSLIYIDVNNNASPVSCSNCTIDVSGHMNIYENVTLRLNSATTVESGIDVSNTGHLTVQGERYGEFTANTGTTEGASTNYLYAGNQGWTNDQFNNMVARITSGPAFGMLYTITDTVDNGTNDYITFAGTATATSSSTWSGSGKWRQVEVSNDALITANDQKIGSYLYDITADKWFLIADSIEMAISGDYIYVVDDPDSLTGATNDIVQIVDGIRTGDTFEIIDYATITAHSTNHGYIYGTADSEINIQYADISELGADTPNKYGITTIVDGTSATASFTVDKSKIYNGYEGIRLSTPAKKATISNNSIYSHNYRGITVDGPSQTIFNNRVYSITNNSGINIDSLSDGSVVYSNYIYGNSGVGFGGDAEGALVYGNTLYLDGTNIFFQSADACIVHNNKSFAAVGNAGIFPTDNVNITSSNQAFFNTGRSGFECWNCDPGTVFANNYSFKNPWGLLNRGNQAASDILLYNERYGADGENGSADILTDGGVQNTRVYNSLLGSTTEVSGISDDGEYLISRKHDNTSGVVKVWNDYSVPSDTTETPNDEDTEKYNYSDNLWEDSATPHAYAGTGTEYTNLQITFTTALATSEWYRATLTTAATNGGTFTIYRGAATTTDLTATPSTYNITSGAYTETNTGVRFTIQDGATDYVLGDTYIFFVFPASGDTNTQKTMTFQQTRDGFTVGSGTTIEMMGTSSATTVVTSTAVDSNYYYFNITSATLKADYFSMTSLATTGLYISGASAYVAKLSNGTFDSSEATGAYIRIQDFTSKIVLPNMVFDPDAADNVSYNISNTTAGTNINWQLCNSSGNLGGVTEGEDHDLETGGAAITWQASCTNADSGISTATPQSFQRKTWYDNTRFWRSFFNGSAIEFWYSIDNGSTWIQNTSATLYLVNDGDYSIEADSGNAFIVYTEGTNIKARKASSYPGTSFSWGSATTVYTGSAGGTFGKTGIGAVEWTPGSQKIMAKYSLSTDGTATDLKIYAHRSGAGTTNVKGFIYADSGGAPAALKGTATPTQIATTANAWYTMTFPSPVSLTAGTYWLGILYDVQSSIHVYNDTGAANCSAFKETEDYATGPTDPCVAPSGYETREMTIYADLAAEEHDYPAITKDTASKLWITATDYDVNASSYYFKAVQSSSANEITGWTTSTVIDSSANSNKYGTIVPLNSGDMYAVFSDGTALQGCFYDEQTSDRWEDSSGNACPGSQDTIEATIPSGLTKNMSAVADGTNYDVHLIYSAAATFGKTGIGSFEWTPGSQKIMAKFSLSTAGNAIDMKFYGHRSSAGTTNVKGFIYADSGGAPAGLQGTATTPIQVATTTNAWYTMNFASPVSLSAGTYWLGLLYDVQSSIHVYYGTGAANCSAYDEVEDYATGPSNPCATPDNYENKEMTIYVDLTNTVSYKRWDNGGAGNGAWDSNATTLDTSNNNAYVTLTINSSTRDLYAFWIDTSNQYIYYRRCLVAGAGSECSNVADWASETSWKTNADTKTYLTSNYSGADKIFAEWMEGTTCPYAVKWDIVTLGVTISGNIYQEGVGSPYEGTGDSYKWSSCNGTATSVSLAVNGVDQTNVSCNGTTGAFEFTSVSLADTNLVITIWLDTTGGDKGVLYTKNNDTSSDITGLKVYKNRVWIQSESSQSITNANINSYDQGDDGDIPVASDGTNVTVDSGVELHINTGDTFAPGGAVSTPKLHLVGTYTGASETLTLSGSGNAASCDATEETIRPLCIDGGTFTPTTNTTTFTGTSASNVEAATYYNLTFNGNTTFSALGSTTVNNELAIATSTAVFAMGANNLTVGSASVASSGSVKVAGTLSQGTATTTILSASGTNCIGANGASCIGTPGTIGFYNLTIGNSSNTFQTNVGGTGTTFTAAGALTVTASSTLALGAYSINVGNVSDANSGSIKVAGTLSQSSSGTVTVLSASGTNCIGANGASCAGTPGTIGFYNLTIGNSSNTFQTNVGGTNTTFTAAGDLTVTASSTLALGAYSITVGNTSTISGSIKVGGTISQSASGTVTILNSFFNTNCIGANGSNCTGTPGTIGFYNLTIGNGSFNQITNVDGTGTTMTIAGTLTVADGDFLVLGNHSVTVGNVSDANVGSLKIGGFLSQSSPGTVTILSASGTNCIGANGSNCIGTPGTIGFYNLTIGDGSTTFQTNIGGTETTFTAAGALTVTASSTLALGAYSIHVGNVSDANSGSIKVAGTLSQSSSGTVTVLSASGTNCIGANGASCAGTPGTIGFYNLTIGSGATTFTTSIGGTSPTVTVAGVLNITTNTTLRPNATTTITLSGAGTPITRAGTFDAATNPGSTVQYTSGTGITALASAVMTTTSAFHNLTISGTGNFTANVNFTTNGALTIGNATDSATLLATTNNPTIIVTGAMTINNAGAFTGGSGNLTVQGDFTLNSSSTFTKGSGTLILDGGTEPSPQYFDDKNGTKQDLGTVQIGTSPAVTKLKSNMTADSLTVASGDTLYTQGWDLNIATFVTATSTATLDCTDSGGANNAGDGTIINLGTNWTVASDATFTAQESETYPTTVIFDETAVSSVSPGGTNEAHDFYNFQVAKTAVATATLLAAIDVENNLNISTASSVLSVSTSNYAINVAGSWANSGTFAANSGTVTFDAVAGSKTLSGRLNNSVTNSAFYKVNFNGSGGGWTIGDAMRVTANATDTLLVSQGTVTLGDGDGDNLEINGKMTVGSASGIATFQTMDGLANTASIIIDVNNNAVPTNCANCLIVVGTTTNSDPQGTFTLNENAILRFNSFSSTQSGLEVEASGKLNLTGQLAYSESTTTGGTSAARICLTGATWGAGDHNNKHVRITDSFADTTASGDIYQILDTTISDVNCTGSAPSLTLEDNDSVDEPDTTVGVKSAGKRVITLNTQNLVSADDEHIGRYVHRISDNIYYRIVDSVNNGATGDTLTVIDDTPGNIDGLVDDEAIDIVDVSSDIKSGITFEVYDYTTVTGAAGTACNGTTFGSPYHGYVLGKADSESVIQYADICDLGKDTNNYYGIQFNSVNDNDTNEGATVQKSRIRHGQYGIYLSSSSNNTLSSNNAWLNSSQGITLSSSSESNILSSNAVYGNFYTGVALGTNTKNNILSSNIAYGHSNNGLSFYYSSNNTVSSNVTYANDKGFYPNNYSHNNIFSSNVAYGNNSGFSAVGTEYNNIFSSNTAYDNSSGFIFSNSNNIIFSNNAYNNSSGFYFSNSDDNTLFGNQSYNNAQGLYTGGGSSGTIVIGDDYGVSGVNSTADIDFNDGDSGSTMKLYGVDLASSTEIPADDVSWSGAYVISYKHDSLATSTKVWGEYTIPDDNLETPQNEGINKFNYSDDLWDDSITDPSYSGTGDKDEDLDLAFNTGAMIGANSAYAFRITLKTASSTCNGTESSAVFDLFRDAVDVDDVYCGETYTDSTTNAQFKIEQGGSAYVVGDTYTFVAFKKSSNTTTQKALTIVQAGDTFTVGAGETLEMKGGTASSADKTSVTYTPASGSWNFNNNTGSELTFQEAKIDYMKVNAGTVTVLDTVLDSTGTPAAPAEGATLNVDWYVGAHLVSASATSVNVDTGCTDVVISENSATATSTVWKWSGGGGGGWGTATSVQETGTGVACNGSAGKIPQPGSNGAIRIREYARTSAGYTYYRYNIRVKWQSSFGEYDYYERAGLHKYVISLLYAGGDHDNVIGDSGSNDWHRENTTANNTEPALDGPPAYGTWYLGMRPGLDFEIVDSDTDTPPSLELGTLGLGNNFTNTDWVDLKVATAASNGYIVTAWAVSSYTPNILRHTLYPATYYIQDFDGTYETPNLWGSTCMSGGSAYCGFGYTSSDDSVGGSNRYLGGTKYAKFPSTGAGNIISDYNQPVLKTDTGGTYRMTAKTSVPLTQTTGDYSTTIVFVCTAQY